jgi:hypothetical protein
MIVGGTRLALTTFRIQAVRVWASKAAGLAAEMSHGWLFFLRLTTYQQRLKRYDGEGVGEWCERMTRECECSEPPDLFWWCRVRMSQRDIRQID